MLISLNWIKDFVDLPEKSPDQYATDLTLATAEVEKWYKSGEHLSKITIAKVDTVNPHPKADKLKLVTFSSPKLGEKEVVCGAPNVRPGIKVAYAPVGTEFPNGLILESKKIRGIVSEGMLCSEAELEVGEDAAGIWELPDDAALDQNLAEYLQRTPDLIIEIDNKSLTHRPDLWGHIGIAREFSTIYRVPLKDRFGDPWKDSLRARYTKDASPIVPVIEGDTACYGYAGVTVENVTVKESPLWMQERLLACGLRPINNMVDIGNYVMLEVGGPLHMFDCEMIKGSQIIIKRVDKACELEMLDGSVAKLEAGDTVVADAERPLVVAGIMGGLDSGVTDGTKNVFVEAANWKPAQVRRLSTRLGLRTDSSQRFEKALDTHLVERTTLRAVELILEFCPEAKIRGKYEWAGEDLSKYEPLKIETSYHAIDTLLGKEVAPKESRSILEHLGFGVEDKAKKVFVTVPSYRATKDIECEADLVEEVGRIVGYDNVTPAAPQNDVTAVRMSNAKQLHRKIQDYLVLHAAALEVMTYPMISDELLDLVNWGDHAEGLVLSNAISEEHDRMRPSMIPSLLEALAANTKHYERFRFFELGRTYHPAKDDFSVEHSTLGIVCYSQQDSCFVDAINITEGLFENLMLPVHVQAPNKKSKNPIISTEWSGCHPFEFQEIKVMGKIAGAVFSINPALLGKLKVKGNATFVIIELQDFEDRLLIDKRKYKSIPKVPGSIFDCTVVAKSRVPVGDLMAPIQKLKVKELQDVNVVTVFELNDEEKAVTLRTTFLDPEKTLPGEQIKEYEDKVVGALNKAGFPLKQ